MAAEKGPRVEVARFKPFYLGLFLSMALLVALPLLIAGHCRVRGPGVACPLGLVLSLAAALAVAAAHELLHYLAARALGVRGLRFRLHRGFGAVMMVYDYMTPRQYLYVALAPQVLSVALALAAYMLQGLPRLLSCIGLGANLAGGAPDVVNALYFYLVHGSAARFEPLYGEDGGVAGGVVVYPDGRLVVYVF